MCADMSPLASRRVPIIDFGLFEAGEAWRDHLAAQIDWAARRSPATA
jgi:hypothetical protein